MNKSITTLALSAMFALLGFSSCTTNDVEDLQENGERNLYEIKDRALGEYLVYNSTRTDENKLPFGTAIVEDGKIYLDTDKAAKAENLYLVKTDAQITALKNAGLATAEVKIVDMDGLQYFTALKTLKITSNSVERMELTALTQLETVEMNNNLVPALDLSNNTKLIRFRYGGSSSAAATSKLSTISFAKNNVIEHIYLKNQNLQKDGFTLPENYSSLKELDLSDNPGAPFTIPADLLAQLKASASGGVTDVPQGGEDGGDDGGNDGGDDNQNLYTLPDEAFGEYLYYLSTTKGTLPAGLIVKEGTTYQLDKTIAATVTVVNVAKTSGSLTELSNAGLQTANTLIGSADGLQFFTALTEFTATSNQFTQPIPLTTLTHLETLQVNTAGVASLDLSGNPNLVTLNCNGSSKAGYGKLSSIDLTNNSKLVTLNLKSNNIQTINVSNLTSLKTLDLSSNPGATFAIPAAIFNNLTTKAGVKSE